MNLALFDLDHTLLPVDSDYEWGQFLARIGAVDPDAFEKSNAEWFAQYQAGTLDPVKYLEFAFGTLSKFPRKQLDAWHQQFMQEVILPTITPAARALLQKHLDAGDLVAIVTATNSFVTEPIAKALGVDFLIASDPETTDDGEITGRLADTPTYGPGKVIHTHAWLATMDMTLASFPRSYFYSDSHNDLPLMKLVTDPVATNPNALLKAHASEHGWPILNLFDAQ
ncbi:HAD superfamily hydrolase (TIGR01490 family) [Collimonas sp. PA-H2]|jgi:HAD superfamily hydrolase (TIGR01490 family)|uniref:HAD phosphoserine phosphatase-like hydrolase, IB family protein n=1 Tax=Collimonas pratensis TaxID=279113 RepID=A0A127QAP7_9BURK|nr:MULTISPECIES: HAD family hydrolase [Collimonas]AMP07094.1 HAD phosphoserine phosphatase-like hydrolase, IB family protein [Collimonas pratensis]AMP16834.1 HAD phosphoserine phosphatase-like hydrolase, IB family protein [Collimonas pratensis]NKI71979.1 HAD-IB family hydrolase [Collimonas pratensis]PFH09062.1 HAD superfamily hydrolase (TIGR01490 family) [Collimonas sp. PA-H2]HWX02912.1 HAD family hydrolase [Collimonas sp.]